MSLDEPEHAEPPAVRTIPRRYVALGLIILATILVGVLIVVRNIDGPNDTSDVETITPAPGSLLTTLSQVPAATSAAVGATSPVAPITPPEPTRKAAQWSSADGGDGASRPVVFFYGAEFAPYAAAERWPLVVALSRFGSFGQLGLMESSPSVAFSDTATFTFWHAAYKSDWVDLEAVERYSALNPSGKSYTALQALTPAQAEAVAAYDPSAKTFPMLDIANRYVLAGSSFSPSVLDGLTQSQVAADLAFPTSPVAQAVLASANEITAAICTTTGQRPGAVCHSRGVLAADDKMQIPRAG
jgi:Domain of unknown function (DUF929)